MSTKKLSKNVLFYGLSNALKSLVPFLMLPILTSQISAEGYGVLSIIETSLLFLTPFVLFNVDTAISVEFFKVNKEKLAQIISNGIFLTFAAFISVSIIFYLLKSPLANALSVSTGLILLLPLMVLLKVIPAIVLVIFQSEQKPIPYLTFSIGQTMLDFALSALFVLVFKFGFEGRLEGIYIAAFIFSVIGAFILWRAGFLTTSIHFPIVKDLIQFGAPLIPHAMGATVIALSDRYFISFFNGNEQVGIYTASYQVAALMLLFSRSVNQAWSPMLYKLLSESNFKQIQKLSFFILSAFAIVGVLTFLAKDLIFSLFIDPSFYAAKTYFGWILLGFIFQAFYFVFSGFLFYYKKTKLLASITFFGAVINLLLNYVLIQKYQVLGVAYATAITWFLFLIATFVSYKKLHRQHA